jgi:hypothetical protein
MTVALSRKSAARCVLAAALLAAMGSAAARNDQMFLPMEPALKDAQATLRPDVALRFGSESAAGADASLGTLEAHGVGDPNGAINTNAGGSRPRRSDGETCQDALRKALAELQAKARTRGATAVVGIIGNYHGIAYSSTTQYECHVGVTRAVVDLRGQLAR